MTLDRKERLKQEMLRRLAAQQARKDRDRIARLPRDGELPLSYAQRRLWFLDRLEPGRADYNSGICLRLRGDLDPEARGGAGGGGGGGAPAGGPPPHPKQRPGRARGGA
ncbi:hypothetical protein ACFV08_19920, partial [Streptomyces fradiae]|uniref:hypothetical protein n=1 Tax=Streptomyces fradiae TaxID=1906 RepID=UPI00368B0E5C